MYEFGDFVLDPQLYQLRRSDQVVPLEPKVFDVLRYLLEHADRVATKHELLEALWPHEVVTEAVLPTNINALRRALGQKRGEKSPIETIHGRGYRFSMPVRRSLLPPSSPSLSMAPLSTFPMRLAADASYIGQPALFEKLHRILARALAEQGQICLLTGEAGIGKTRTALQLVELARAHAADVWVGSCDEGQSAPPLWPFQQILRCALESEGAETLRGWLGPLAEELGSLLPLLGSARETRLLSAVREHESFRVFDALLRVLTQASRVRPRLLWLEDMHRADDASWQLLRMLAPHLEHASVLVVVTVRSVDDLTAVQTMQRNLDLLARSPVCQHVRLRGLDVAEVRQLASVLLGREIERDLAQLLYDKSGGNPLFVRELVEWLDARGRCDAAALREGPHLAPPEMIRHLLRRRVLRLGAPAQAVLEAGAVAGSSWDATLVERVVPLANEALSDAIDVAIEHRVLVPVAGRVNVYRFSHDLVRDTLYADLSTRERRGLHLRLAAAIEDRIAWLGSDGVHEIAQHLYAALPEGDPQNAVTWLERAARLSEERGAYREAARFYRCALDAARLLPVADPALSQALHVSQQRLTGLARASAHSSS